MAGGGWWTIQIRARARRRMSLAPRGEFSSRAQPLPRVSASESRMHPPPRRTYTPTPRYADDLGIGIARASRCAHIPNAMSPTRGWNNSYRAPANSNTHNTHTHAHFVTPSMSPLNTHPPPREGHSVFFACFAKHTLHPHVKQTLRNAWGPSSDTRLLKLTPTHKHTEMQVHKRRYTRTTTHARTRTHTPISPRDSLHIPVPPLFAPLCVRVRERLSLCQTSIINNIFATIFTNKQHTEY